VQQKLGLLEQQTSLLNCNRVPLSISLRPQIFPQTVRKVALHARNLILDNPGLKYWPRRIFTNDQQKQILAKRP